MKKISFLLSLAAALALSAGIIAVLSGCDDTDSVGDDALSSMGSYPSESRTDLTSLPASTELSVSPQSVSAILAGETFLFKVSGGNAPFTWSVSSGSGTIVAQADTRNAIYTVSSVSENNVIVKDKDGKAGMANVVISVSSLSISPTTSTVHKPGGAGDGATSVTLTALGGKSPYSWSVAYSSEGSLSAATGASTVYSYTAATGHTNAVNSVTVTDSKGSTASATINHHD